MELGRILLYSADELWRYVPARLKYRSVCYSSSKLHAVEWWYPPVPEWDGLLPPVSCGERPIIDGVRTLVAYTLCEIHVRVHIP